MDGIQTSRFVIRSFVPDDTRGVREIAWETAFSGTESRRWKIDRELLGDLLTLYYTRFEPESIFVADIDGEVAGYIMGSTNLFSFKINSVRIFLLRIVPGIITRRYKGVMKSLPLLLFGILGVLKGEHDPDIKSEYPAHLHINIGRRYQRAGLGSALINAWLRYIGLKHVKGVYLSTTSINMKAIHFFQKHGFKPLYRYRSTFWSYASRRTVYMEILGRKIE